MKIWTELDFDGDGSVRAADAWAWLERAFFLPGDATLEFIVNRVPLLAGWLELSPESQGGLMAGCIAAAIWLTGLIAAGALLEAIRNVDRLATAYLTGRWEALRRELRVTRRRLVSWIGLMRHRRQSRSPSLDVDTVMLEKLETAILRLHGNADECSVLSADEVAASLKLPARTAELVLRRLRELCLIERGFGTDGGADGHRITRLGQMYLIEH